MKNWIFKSLLILLTILLIGCTTQDGSLYIQDEKGILYLTLENSDLTAKIFINDLPTKYSTPATINLFPGKYNIKALLPGYIFIPDSIETDIVEKELSEISFKTQPTSTGNLKIESNVTGFDILLDGLLIQNIGSEINNIPTGKHYIEILKTGFFTNTMFANISANSTEKVIVELEKKSDVFLVEHFSNVNCNPCAERDETLENYIAENDSLELISIGYHPNFPSDSDPIYLAAREENLGRTDYYNISVTPGFFINGKTIAAYSNNHLVRGINQHVQTYQPEIILEQFSIIIENHIEDVEGRVVINSINNYSETLSLRIVLIEKNLVFNEPPGTNGMDQFHDIIREFYPDHNGVEINIDENKMLNIAFSIRKKYFWENDLQIIAFLQNDETREVVATTKSIIIKN